ncbi:serine/threonine-protein kinase [Nocardia carnea]|uniref:serine/threonine-protein kinase n=1 Tax=Nocardia carnea TaxID=37328 RepID=UPI0024568A4F|nr:serine/threonine-protein kinase [Nocardia carnea]
MLQPGASVAGYRIVRRIGAGGMGVVYLADHPRLPRQDVLKLLPAHHLDDPQFRGRFDREADLAARLKHPNIVTVHDRGVADGQPWIAMEYVPGTDAAALVGAADLGPRRAARIIDDAARGLDHAHRNGMLHRDVKPGNILVTPDPDREFGERALLTDFGIARLALEGTDLTRTGEVIATVAYAAPEQFTGGPVDHRADVYALGCTLFVLLTGEKPFAMDSAAAVISAHLHTPPPPASGRVPTLPPAIDAVLSRALAKDPAQRYDSCRAFSEAAIQALETVAGHRTGTGAAPSVPLAAAPSTIFAKPPPEPRPGPVPRGPGGPGGAEIAGAAVLRGAGRARRWWIPVVVLAVAAALGAGAGFVARDESAVGVAAVAETGPETAALPNLVTADGMAYFIDHYRREFGDTVIDTATVYPDFLLVQRLDKGSPRNFRFDGDGFDELGGPVPSWAKGRTIDLADIDLKTLAAVLAGAPASVRLDQGAVEHLGIGFELIAPADAGPVIDIYVEDPAGGTGHLSVSFAGEPLQVFPAD